MEGSKKFYISWSDGYRSGFVDYAGDFVSDDLAERANFFTSEKDAQEWLDDYTEKHPLHCYMSVADYVPEIALTEEEIAACRNVVPPAQLAFTLELTEGEDGEFYKEKLREIAETYHRINTGEEIINKDGSHPVGFRYFLGETELYVSEIYQDGAVFGFNILNGDTRMAEWGYSGREEILSIPNLEMDYHVPSGASIERLLFDRHPEDFPEYRKFSERKRSNNNPEIER